MIELKRITKIYTTGATSFTALQNIEISIAKGEFVTVVGASGSGKSTLLHIIGLLSHFDAGTYLYQGQNISSLKPQELSDLRLEQLGFVFQNFLLLNHLTALENVELPLGYLGISPLKRKEKAQQMLDLVGLKNKLKNKPGELSGGEQQRVAIARALVNSPELILADEPTGNLDSQTSRMIMDLFYKLNKLGHTIILVTHEQEFMDKATRVVQISDGQIKVNRNCFTLY